MKTIYNNSFLKKNHRILKRSEILLNSLCDYYLIVEDEIFHVNFLYPLTFITWTKKQWANEPNKL